MQSFLFLLEYSLIIITICFYSIYLLCSFLLICVHLLSWGSLLLSTSIPICSHCVDTLVLLVDFIRITICFPTIRYSLHKIKSRFLGLDRFGFGD